MSIWFVKLQFFHSYNVLQSPATSAVVLLLQKQGAASAMLDWAALQLFGVSRMVQGHKLTTGLRYSNFPFSQCSKDYNAFICVCLQKSRFLTLVEKKLHEETAQAQLGPT